MKTNKKFNFFMFFFNFLIFKTCGNKQSEIDEKVVASCVVPPVYTNRPRRFFDNRFVNLVYRFFYDICGLLDLVSFLYI